MTDAGRVKEGGGKTPSPETLGFEFGLNFPALEPGRFRVWLKPLFKPPFKPPFKSNPKGFRVWFKPLFKGGFNVGFKPAGGQRLFRNLWCVETHFVCLKKHIKRYLKGTILVKENLYVCRALQKCVEPCKCVEPNKKS